MAKKYDFSIVDFPNKTTILLTINDANVEENVENYDIFGRVEEDCAYRIIENAEKIFDYIDNGSIVEVGLDKDNEIIVLEIFDTEKNTKRYEEIVIEDVATVFDALQTFVDYYTSIEDEQTE